MMDYNTCVEYSEVKEQYLAKKREVEWKQREEKLLFSEFVRLSRNYTLDCMQGCARFYFDEWKGFLTRINNGEKLSKKEYQTFEAYRSVFCENFFPECMKDTDIIEMMSYGYECVGREFYFKLNGKEYGIYIPCPENINERNFHMFGGDVSEFEVLEHDGITHSVLINTHELGAIKSFLEELAGKKKRGRPKKNGI